MKGNHLKHALESIASRGVPENTNLWPNIAAKLERKSFMTTLRTRPLAAVLLAVLILLALTGVAYALGKALGYIPGIGLVDTSSLRVLAEPVAMTRDGITLSVEQVAVDSSQTVVRYKLEGLTGANFDSDAENAPRCYSEAVLRLPSEELQRTDQIGSSGGIGYEKRVTYPAIAPSVNEFTFALPCIQFASPGKAPEDWELSLRLIPAPADMNVFPAIEIGNSNRPISAVTKQDGPPSLNPETISLTLDRAVQMDDGYLLYATINWGQASVNYLDTPDPANIHLLDVNGEEMQFSLVLDDENARVFRDQRQTVIAIKTAPVQAAGPLTLSIDAVPVEATVDASFTFEPGSDPKPGQVWELNQEIKVGYSQTLRVVKATYTTNANPGLSIVMESETGISDAWLADVTHALLTPQAGGGSISRDAGPFTGEFFYAGNFPSDPITVKISSIAANISGSWKVEWTPPATSPVIPVHADACVNMAKFNQALKENPPLPQGLGGKVVLYGPYQGNNKVWKNTIVNLDGSDQKLSGDGGGSFSPDGTKLAFSRELGEAGEQGIFITDLAANQTIKLPGTGQGDFNPIWSPDGSQIVFNRGMGVFELYAVNADGSNMRRLTYDRGQEFAIGWMPDGQHLLYTLPGKPYEYTDHIVDVQTGKIEYFSNEEFLAMSSNAKYKITLSRDPTNIDAWSSYFSNLDGSDRWALSDSDIVLQSPIWSPDGEWLLVSLSKLYDDKNTPALIHLTDCQIIPLSKLDGIVLSWLP